MSVLSIQEVGKIAVGAGFKGTAIITAVAIAMAESGLNPDAVGDVGLEDTTWGPSVGLWQVRSLKAELGTGGQRDESANHDPAHNARAAFAISSDGTNFDPWSTFKNGAYKEHLAAVEAALNPSNDPHESSASSTVSESDPHRVHYVQEGDTLSTIALRYGFTWAVLQRFNGIKDANVIQIGEGIKLPFVYVIRPGDTLSALAERWHTSVDSIAFINQINPNRIVAGHKLYY